MSGILAILREVASLYAPTKDLFFAKRLFGACAVIAFIISGFIVWFLKNQELIAERAKNEHAEITGKIKEVYFKARYDGLHITMLVFLTNHRATVTIQDFRLRFSADGADYVGQAYDVEDYSIVREEEPRPSTFTRREVWEPLSDLRDDNTTPLSRNTHREGWLRFRLLKLPYNPEHGQVTLEVIDASDKLHQIKISDPWPQTGRISLTSRLDEVPEAKPAKKTPKKGRHRQPNKKA